MTTKPPDANSIIEVSPFDVFRVEGDIDRLQGQRLSKEKISQPKELQSTKSVRHLQDQKVETDAQRLIRDARYSQQEALKDLHAISDSGPSIQRALIDGQGPERQRAMWDGTGPEHQRVISDAEGPILSSHVRLASLHEPLTKARTAQQSALKEIHAIKDMIYSSTAQQQDRLPGPINARILSDADGPTLSPISSSSDAVEDRKTISTEKLRERIQKARAEQLAALKNLHAMQDADGPIKDRAMSDLDFRIAKANQSQLTAIGYLKKVEDAVGPLVHTTLTDADRNTNAKAGQDTVGPARLSNSDDSNGPAIPKSMGDATGPSTPRGVDDSAGPINPRDTDDAAGPIKRRHTDDAAGPIASKAIDDAVGPTDLRTITDAKGPTIFHVIKDAPMPQKAGNAAAASSADPRSRQNSIAERIAKIKADQRDAIQHLDDLDKENDKPLL